VGKLVVSKNTDDVFGAINVGNRASVASRATTVDIDFPSTPSLFHFDVFEVGFGKDALSEVAGLCGGQFVVGGCHLVWSVGIAARRLM